MFEVKTEKIRLIKGVRGYLIGSTGILITFEENFFAIIWDNQTVELRSSLESDSFFVDSIIEGYSLLTMDDVLSISFGDYENLIRIRDEEKIQVIIREYLDYTKVLRRREERCCEQLK